ncbi:hypothetical protein ACF044_10740 [Microbacterium sp. NPDC016588]
MTLQAWQAAEPKYASVIGPGVAYQWICFDPEGDNDQGLNWSNHVHTIECLWVWHDCALILGADSVAPGARFGWRPSGVAAHTLVKVEPLTITASVYWPDCCNKHGFITDGVYRDV